MSIFGDIFKGVTGIFGGGGGAGNAIAGALTSQRIPGQTQAGEYTPPQGGFGTYNYIPTGATQIDPQLIQQILGSQSTNAATAGQATNLNNLLLSQNQPTYGSDGYANTFSNLGQFAYDAGQALVPLATDYRNQGAQAWGAAQNQLGNYANLLSQAQNNPYAQSYISNAQNIGQGIQGAGSQLQGLSQGYLGGVQGQVNQLLSNPYQQLAQMGGNQAGAMLQGTGQNLYNQGQQFSGITAGNLPAASAVLGTAFDPQQALYNRTLQQTQDQLGTYLAQTGLTGSGAGAGIAADALKNFNIDWQNNQLGRQTQGLNAYTQGMTGAGQNLAQGANLQTGGAGTFAQGAQMPFNTYQQLGQTQLGNLGALGQAAQTGATTLPTAGGLQLQGAGAGYNAYSNDLANQLQYATAYSNGANQLGSAYGQQGQGINTLENITNQILNMRGVAAGLPQQGLSNYLQNAAGASNLTNQNVAQMLQYLQAVMSGSANAANAASGAQSRTTDQNAAAAAGLAPLINSGLSSLGNLFGGGTNSYGLSQNQIFNPAMTF